jgi:hypothetical protein
MNSCWDEEQRIYRFDYDWLLYLYAAERLFSSFADLNSFNWPRFTFCSSYYKQGRISIFFFFFYVKQFPWEKSPQQIGTRESVVFIDELR